MKRAGIVIKGLGDKKAWMNNTVERLWNCSDADKEWMITSASGGGMVPCRVTGRPWVWSLSEGQWGSVETWSWQSSVGFCEVPIQRAWFMPGHQALMMSHSRSWILPASLFLQGSWQWLTSDLGLRTLIPQINSSHQDAFVESNLTMTMMMIVLMTTVKVQHPSGSLERQYQTPLLTAEIENAHLEMPRREQKSPPVVCAERGVCVKGRKGLPL